MNTFIDQPTASPLNRWRLILFIGGIITGVIAEALILFATPLLVLDYTGMPSAAGLAFAVEWLPAVLIFPFAGVITDRLGGRHIFLYSSLLRALVVLLILWLIQLLPDYAVALLMVNAAFMSIFMAPNRMAVEKIVPQICHPQHLAIAQSAVQNSELIARTAGPALAAYLALISDKETILLIAAMVFFTSMLPITYLKMTRPGSTTEIATGNHWFRGSVIEMWRGCLMLWQSASLMRLAALNFIINIVFAVSMASHAAIIKYRYQLDDSAYGILNSAAAGIAILNLLLVPLLLRRLTIYHLAISGLLLIIAGMLFSAVSASFNLYLSSYVIATVGVTIFNVYNRTQRIRVLPADDIGKVLGPFYVLNLAALPLGGGLVALLVDYYDNQILIFGAGAILFIAGPALLLVTQKAFVQDLRCISASKEMEND
ncbi:MAG: hypothetical protein Tsb002_04220 [Wenzhouxiangellaceae bacterium]